jgi:phosphate acetyltransferase
MRELMPFQEPELPQDLLASLKGADPVRCVIVGAGSALALETAAEARRMGLIEPILVGPSAAVERLAEEIGFDLAGLKLLDAEGEAAISALSAQAAREHEAGFVIKGSVHTDVYLRAFLSSKAGFRTERLASHVFHMTAPGLSKPLLISDAAFNVSPGVGQRIQIAGNAIEVARSLGIEPADIAVLSATESVIESMPSSVEAREIAAAINKAHAGVARAFGPVAFDLAVSASAAQIKDYDHPAAGNADILLTPTIEVGNALFKMMVYFSGACAAGIVVGLKVPLVLTSRADPVAARIASIALAAKASLAGQGRV